MEQQEAEDTARALHEVLQDVMDDPRLIVAKGEAMDALPGVSERLGQALAQAFVQQAEEEGIVNLHQTLLGLFQLGFVAGTTFQQRGYRL